MPDPAEDLGAILLDRLARAAAVAPLPPGEVDREVVGRQRQAGRHALDRDAQRRAVRFAGGEESEGGHRSRSSARRAVSRARWRSPARRRPPRPSCRRRRLGGRFAVGGRPARLALGRSQPAGPCLGQLPLHQLERCRLAGPQGERRRALVEQHQLAVGDRAAGRRRIAQQAGPGVDEVEHQQVGVERLGRDRAGVAGQPDRGGVDQDARLGQLGFDDRLVPGHRPQLHVRGAAPEMLDQALGPVEVAVEHDDPLEALGDEPVDDGPGAAAGAQHDRLARHLLLAHEPVEGDLEAGHVRVVADQPLALAGDGVDRARGVRLLGQAVDQRHDPFLVRDRDVGAQEVVGPQLGDRVGQRHRAAIPQLVARVDAGRVEGGLLHRAGQRMGDGVSDEDHALGHARTLSRSSKKPG